MSDENCKTLDDNNLEEKSEDFSQDNSEVKTRVIRKMWSYIDQNFHKFTEQNKVKVALALAQKDMPTQLDGKVSETIINVIKASTNMEVKEKINEHNDRRLSINV